MTLIIRKLINLYLKCLITFDIKTYINNNNKRNKFNYFICKLYLWLNNKKYGKIV